MEINPEIELEVIKSQMTPDNIDEIMKNRCDYVCDCIDDIEAKAYICNYLFKKGSTFIVSGGAGGRIDPTLLKIGDVGKKKNTVLLAVAKNSKSPVLFPMKSLYTLLRKNI